MELEILRMLIEKRNKKLSEPFVRHQSYNYLIEARDNLDEDSKLIMSYLIMSTNKTKEECFEITKGLGLYNLKFTDAEFALITNALVYYKVANVLPQVRAYYAEKNPFKAAKAWGRIELDKNDKTMVMRVIDIAKKFKIDLVKLIDFLEENPNAFYEMCSLVIDIKGKDSDTAIGRAKREVYGRYMNNSEAYSIFNRKVKPNCPSLEATKNTIKKFVEGLELEERNYYKSAQLEQYHNENALNLLEKELQKPEITNVRPLIKRLVDQQIKEVILAIVYKHNLNYAKSLNDEYDKLMSNSTTRYLSLLHEYGITIKEEDLGDIKSNSIEELEEILSSLKTLVLSEDLFLPIINITNLETTREIKEYVTKGYISKTLLSNNIELFNSNNVLLNIVKTNINLLNDYGLNPTSFYDLEEIIFIESSLLEENLKVLESYNLIKSIKNSSNYNFLLNSDLKVLIDKYLELGYESILEIDLDILNYSDTRRVEILANMGMTLTKEELIEMFEYDKFFIPDEILDDYIPEPIVVTGDIDITLDDLLEYRKTTRTIEIEGHLISINKILRALNNNMSIKQAIYFNMNLDRDSYEEIEKSINGKAYIKQN
ncbi:MAG: hypothetical protein IJ463_02695 [Bacilli bacterium]|nr:hypothetical protein [Bacilli bacterium]